MTPVLLAQTVQSNQTPFLISQESEEPEEIEEEEPETEESDEIIEEQEGDEPEEAIAPKVQPLV